MLNLTTPIRRDANKLAHTEYCREHADGSLTLTVGRAEQRIEAADLAPGAPFAMTLQRLQGKTWWALEVEHDLVSVVHSNYLAKANGWR